jgi:hypothetical protein
MRTILIILVAAFVLDSSEICNAQNFIGMHKDLIIKTMNETQKNLKLNTDVVNPHYNYLKYEDKINEITVLFFLSDKDCCTLIRKIYDYSNINDAIAELNKKYTSEGSDTWYYMDKEKKYCVVLKEEEWFFTVTTSLKE